MMYRFDTFNLTGMIKLHVCGSSDRRFRTLRRRDCQSGCNEGDEGVSAPIAFDPQGRTGNASRGSGAWNRAGLVGTD
jgi:hypothetical protein